MSQLSLIHHAHYRRLFVALLIAFHEPGFAEDQRQTGEVDALPEVKVTSKVAHDQPSEQTKSYTVNATATATRLNTSLRDTPQSISVITRQLMDDFRALTVNDALSLATGVRVEQFETDRSEYTARGFNITNFQIDGLSTPITYGTQYGDLDVALYDRIEVLRGANGLLTSTGNPSATINFIRKRPTKDFKAQINATAGSWDNRRLDADVSGALNADGSVRARLVMAHQEKNSYLDRYSNERNVAYGVIEADLSDRTSVAVGHTYQQNNSSGNNWGSLPLLYADGSPRHYKRSDSTAPHWSYWDVGTNISFAEMTHLFANGWKAKGQLTHKQTEADARLHYIYGNEVRSTGLGLLSYPGRYHTRTEDNVLDFYANGPVELAGRKHELVLGTTLSKADVRDYSRFGAIGTPLASFESAADFPLPTFGPESKVADFSTRTINTYAAARINVMDDLKVTAGGSLLSYDLQGISYGVPQSAKEDNKLTPYLGAVYDINDQHSLYASYTGIYKPQAELGRDFKVLPPLQGKNYEAGVKSEWLNGQLNSTVALFKTEQEHLPQQVGTQGATSIYEGIEAISKGYEFDIAGQLTDRLSMNAGYTRLMSLKNSDGKNVNPYTPRHQMHVAAMYKVPYVEHLKLGANLYWQSETHVDITLQNVGTFRYRQDSYATLNLVANYKIDQHWDAALNLYNVTNEKYLSSLRYAYAGQAYYAAPMSALATLTWRY
ncbi:TonB-dependent siderophore receptor [Methylophilus sp. VKM B-3414]|uniref:TonB-dependent siderophore receptor n=1 Tax=Methylophilus sp. VKM B-3414 TaxID=3076121 RepID=UPI0028C8C28B|nr:TonB-dependent siderophore receptor [Methylophilus sp. VKM B-3414]MDT7849140.1 TonB-dependent siderophore receptor [Methylophilus sp. VKM B-3414]